VFESGDEERESSLPPLLESLAKGEKNAANMVLAYEISVNDEFELDAQDNPNSVKGKVRQTVEKAFWDVVREQLKDGEDDMIIPMIREIREQILNFLAPNSGTRERIKGQIDMELIEQQYLQGCLDYKELFGMIINLLGQLCSPARDDLVVKAKNEPDVVNQMAQISNLLRLMRTDMTNYAIRQIRPVVQKQHIEQQRDYFFKWAEGRGEDAHKYTLAWLRDSMIELSRMNREQKPIPIMRMGYCMTLKKMQNWPETMVNESERLTILGNELRKQIVVASAFLIIAAAVPRQYMCIKEQVKVKFVPIVAQTQFDELSHSLAAQVNEELKRFGLSDEILNAISGQISSITESHSIYKLLWSRVMEFLGEIALPIGNTPPETPKGLQNIQTELAQIASAFGKICSLNRMVFGPYYSQHIRGMIENESGPLTPRKTSQIEHLSRSPDADQSSAAPSGLTPRKQKPSKSLAEELDLD